MKAAVLFAPKEKLRIVDVDLDPPGPDEVRVHLAATGICASDWHTMTGAIPSPTPSVLGHEGQESSSRSASGCKTSAQETTSCCPGCRAADDAVTASRVVPTSARSPRRRCLPALSCRAPDDCRSRANLCTTTRSFRPSPKQ